MNRSACVRYVQYTREQSVADPGSDAYLTPGSGIRGWVNTGNQDPDPGGSARIIFRKALKQLFGLKFSDADPDPGSEIFLTLDQGFGM